MENLTNSLTQPESFLISDLKAMVNNFMSAYENGLRHEVEQTPIHKEVAAEDQDIDHKLVVMDGGECHFIHKGTIILAEANGSYTDIHVLGGRKITISKNLKTLAHKLADGRFIRTHKSFLVNSQFIAKYVKNDGGYLVLENGSNVPVSVRKRELISELIGKLAV